MPPKAEIADDTLPIRRANRLGSVVAIKEFPSRNGPRNKRTLTASIKRTLKHQHLLGSWIPNQNFKREVKGTSWRSGRMRNFDGTFVPVNQESLGFKIVATTDVI